MTPQGRGDLLFAEVPSAVLRVDPDGRIRDVNPAAARLLGRAPRALVASPFLELIHDADRREGRARIGDALRGFDRTWTTRVLRGDGAPRQREVRAVPRQEDARVEEIFVFLSAGDPSVHQPSDEARQLLRLLENVPGDFVLLLDPSGRIRHASGVSWTHHRADLDVLDLAYLDLLDDDDSRELAGEMLARSLGGHDWRGVQSHRRADGASFPVRVVASPLRAPRTGEVAGVMIAGRDITAEHELEQRASRAERLAVVGGLTRGVAEHLDDLIAEEQNSPEQRLARCRTVARRLLEFTDLRDSRPTYVDPGTLVRRALDRWNAGTIRVDLAEPEDLPAVHCDEEAVLRSLVLVFENAREALDGLPDPRVRIVLTPSEESVVITVKDNGPGIPPHDLDVVFRPLEGTRPGQPGLGLAIVRALVQAGGGRVWAEARGESDGTDASRPGAAVRFGLPISALPGARSFRVEPMSLGDQRSVLVIDDDESVRLALRRGLERVGYRVEEAWSGRSAMASVTGGRTPDAIVTDLRMLDGSGYWLLDQFSRYFPGLMTRTIIVTGDTSRSGAFERGCPVLVKPIDFRELVEALHRAIDG
jgi:PAS domain S-box-containing protein